MGCSLPGRFGTARRAYGRREAKVISADAVIIAGDLFDSEKITKRALDTALDVIERAGAIVFFYLPGNHEGDALMTSGRAMPENLKTFGRDWTYYTMGDVTFAGRSEIREGMKLFAEMLDGLKL